MKIIIYLFFIILLFSSCTGPLEPSKDALENNYYKEKHRPQFHFSPETGWMNDPNGMVYYEGEYHLFYQYYPDSTVWGPMHWAHAISTDLIHWEHLPIALYPDEHGYIFSGSAVVDWDNTSGFGEGNAPPLVAMYSYHDMAKEHAGGDDFQTQGIAYSNDKGRTWTKYQANPIIKNPGVRDFRDPKVIWHEDSKQWISAIAALDHLMIYGSRDLKKWYLLSEFGKDLGSHDGVWECPDLFPIIADNGKQYWVLIQNMGTGNPNGGSGTQYFIGQFDGKEYTVDEKFMELLAVQKANIPTGDMFENFESDYSQWTLEGTAFGTTPIHDGIKTQQEVSGYQGNGLANSLHGGDAAIGKMTSSTFIIEKAAINFLIGGGNHRGLTNIQLVVDGKNIRQAEGKNTEQLSWYGWDVSNYIGQEAHIEIVDNYTSEWGHIMVDNIMFADKVATPERSGAVWLDAGRDNYAGVTWSDVPASDGRRLFLGWMSNWAYAQVVPTDVWRSAMTLPWELSIKHVNNIPRLIGNPISEVEKLAQTPWKNIDATSTKINLPGSGLYEMSIETSNTPLSLKIMNSMSEYITLSYDKNHNELSVNRVHSGDNGFSAEFAGVHKVQRISNSKKLKIRAIVDHTSIEIFIDDGQNIFTDLFFPSELYAEMSIESSDPNIKVKIRELKRIWKE